MCYMNCYKNKQKGIVSFMSRNKRRGYDQVQNVDSEDFSSSEANAINVVSERENYTHVFSAGVPGVDVLLYARPTDDISNLVLGELGIDPPSGNSN